MFLNFKTFTFVAHVLSLATYTMQQLNDTAFLQKYDTISDACAQQFNLSNDYVNVQMWNTQKLPNDTNLKCYLSCLNTQLGIIDANGNINDDALVKVSAEFYNVSQTVDIGKDCDIAKDGDLCQTAYDMTQCLLNVQYTMT